MDTFVDQYDPKSPWADQRVRRAANHAINRQAINDAETLGHSIISGSIIPRKFEFALPLEPYTYDPKKAKQLLKEAGYPNGFDAGECSVDERLCAAWSRPRSMISPRWGFAPKCEAMERAAIFAAHKAKNVSKT